jgi:alpha-amylase
MQAFYWDCPRMEDKEFEWWNFLKEKIGSLSEVGFTAIWLTPACNAGEAQSSKGLYLF